MLLCVKSLKACIRRVIEKQLVIQTVRKGCIITRENVATISITVRFCSDLSDYRPFRPLTLRINELTRIVITVE